MLTRCPSCGTTFRLRPEQLGQAEGRVLCGKCNFAFPPSRIESTLRRPTHLSWRRCPPRPTVHRRCLLRPRTSAAWGSANVLLRCRSRRAANPRNRAKSIPTASTVGTTRPHLPTRRWVSRPRRPR
ncbi:MAG: zinc-ribbon domain-containing protein [Sterolibacteriaceae bacterium]|nr:zinc-ribbon domain-containing protein [Sterolibacteriaceae bacterium]